MHQGAANACACTMLHMVIRWFAGAKLDHTMIVLDLASRNDTMNNALHCSVVTRSVFDTCTAAGGHRRCAGCSCATSAPPRLRGRQ